LDTEILLVRSLFLVAVAAALLAPAVSHARDSRPGFPARLQAPGGQDTKKAPGPPMRGERGKRMEHEKGHKSRLTEQERNELHRDLDRANREIYRR
jgi:Spy/CpxP family protein refolding chaperone